MISAKDKQKIVSSFEYLHYKKSWPKHTAIGIVVADFKQLDSNIVRNILTAL